VRWAELTPVADIDEPADLAHLPPGWREALAGQQTPREAAA
jgi:hypothetical protein